MEEFLKGAASKILVNSRDESIMKRTGAYLNLLKASIALNEHKAQDQQRELEDIEPQYIVARKLRQIILN